MTGEETEVTRLTRMMAHHGREALTEQEHQVMTLRLGIGDPEDKLRTLSEVGNAVGLDRYEVFAIEKRAVSKLRHPQWNGTVQPGTA